MKWEPSAEGAWVEASMEVGCATGEGIWESKNPKFSSETGVFWNNSEVLFLKITYLSLHCSGPKIRFCIPEGTSPIDIYSIGIAIRPTPLEKPQIMAFRWVPD